MLTRKHQTRRSAWLAALAILAIWPLVSCFSLAARAAPIAVTEVAPGVYVHQGIVNLFSPRTGGDISNCGFVVGAEAVAVIDTGGSHAVGSGLKEAIRKVTDKPIRYVINTHMHPDHIFGDAAFAADNPQFIGHKKLGRALAARAERYVSANRELMGEDAFAGSRVVPPTVAVDGTMELDLGGRKLVLEAHPTAHTDNDLTVLDAASGTLFMGDLLFSVHTPAIDGSIRGWLALLDKMEARPVARVVPGHGPASMPWPAAAKPLIRYLSTVAGDVRKAIKAGRTLAEAASTAGLSEKDAWELFEAFHARNVSAAFAELEWE